MKRTYRLSKPICLPPTHCHLCTLPIPEEIVSHLHPLFGTIDHIIPLSRGGPDITENRAPAHRVCNQIKGSTIGVGVQLRLVMLDAVSTELRRVGIRIGRKKLERIREEFYGPRQRPRCTVEDLCRWEDDGGPVGAYHEGAGRAAAATA